MIEKVKAFFSKLIVQILVQLIISALLLIPIAKILNYIREIFSLNNLLVLIVGIISGIIVIIIAARLRYRKNKTEEIPKQNKAYSFILGLIGFILLGSSILVNINLSTRTPYDITNWSPYRLQVEKPGDYAITVSGIIGSEGAGYAIEANNLGLNNKRRIILVVSGINDRYDKFDYGKLLKLQINGNPLTVIEGINGMNRNDSSFINAHNGEYLFDISSIKDIRKIELVFYNCTIDSVKIEMFIK